MLPAIREHDAATLERWRRLGAVALGVVFLVAATGKLVHVYEFRGTMSVLIVEVLGGTGLPLSPICAWSTIAVIAVESAVGLGLVLSRARVRFWGMCACLMLVGFSGALVLMLGMDNPPSCGCLGSWDVLRAGARMGAVLGLVRNAALIVLGVWLVSAPVRTELARERVPRAVAGFTLIETLVVILVLAVLMAILVPVLSGAKKRAKSAGVLSALGQCHAAVAQYAQEQRGFFPYLARPGNPDAGTLPDADWGGAPVPSYFAGQTALWPTALLAHGVDLSRLPFMLRPEDGPPRIRTYLWMTHAAVARPEYWVGRDPPDFPPPQVFSGVRQDETVFPSNKGLLVSIGALEQKSTSWEVGFCDGSASMRSIHDPPLQVPLVRPYGQLDWRVLSTSEGIRGRDY